MPPAKALIKFYSGANPAKILALQERLRLSIVNGGNLSVTSSIPIEALVHLDRVVMSSKPQPNLTEGQKACLRLVVDHHTSKEIARILGISSFTVDQRLDAARRKLDAASRKDAAKIFSAMDDKKLSQPFVYEPQRLEHQTANDHSRTPLSRVEQLFSKVSSTISVPPIGGRRHELSKREIIIQSLNIVFFSALIVSLVAIVLMGTMRLFG